MDKKEPKTAKGGDNYAEHAPAPNGAAASSIRKQSKIAKQTRQHDSSKTKHHRDSKDDDHVDIKMKSAVARRPPPKQDFAELLPPDCTPMRDLNDYDEGKTFEKTAKQSVKATGVSRLPPQSIKHKKTGRPVTILEDTKMPAALADSSTSSPQQSSTSFTPRPPQRIVIPGAFAVDGIDGPSRQNDIDDDTYYIGETYPQEEETQKAISAHVVQPGGYDEDHAEILHRIQDLEGRNQEFDVVEAVVEGDADAKFWQRRSSRIAMAALVVIFIVAIVVGAVVGTRNNSAPILPQSNDTLSPAPTEMPSSAPSLSPTTAEFTVLYEFIASSSLDGGAALENPSSPQYQALKWLFNNTNLQEYANAQRLQRYAMSVLYFSTNGDDWLTSTNWLSDESECDWYNKGVTFCDAVSNGVANFDLNGNDLNGKLPAELYLLSNSLGKYNGDCVGKCGWPTHSYGALFLLTDHSYS